MTTFNIGHANLVCQKCGTELTVEIDEETRQELAVCKTCGGSVSAEEAERFINNQGKEEVAEQVKKMLNERFSSVLTNAGFKRK